MNTISTKTYRDKYRLAMFDELLRGAIVAEKVCMVDRTGAKTIQSPYGSQPTVAITGFTGTYAVSAYTTTDSTLTVSEEIKIGEHIFDFEETLSNFSIFENRTKEQAFAVAAAVDKIVVNSLAAGGTGSYTTPTGGFTTAANVVKIFADLQGKVAGYAEQYNGLYVIVESTDLPGIIQAAGTSGYNTADRVLTNGKVTNFMGIDVFVIPSGTFVSDTVGTQTFTNSGKRVFGVKNMATYAFPQGIKFEEKGVTGKTGMELVTYAYTGVKVWASKAALTVAITLA